MHNHLEYPDLPSIAAKSLNDSTGTLRKCFYYYCSTPVWCSDTITPESEAHPVRVIAGKKRLHEDTYDEQLESHCALCELYCIVHTFAADYMERRYGPFDE